jgi:hypothetical protein
MRRRWIWFVVLAACNGGPGFEPPVQRSSAAIVSLGSRIIWRDATGNVVPVIRVENPTPSTQNARAIFLNDDALWAYELDYYTLSPVIVAITAGTLFYDSTDCTGPALIEVPNVPTQARSTIQTSDGTFNYRFPDTGLPTRRLDLHSYGTPDLCTPYDGYNSFAATVMPIAAMTVVTPPTNPFTPPLHPELHND